MRAVITGAAGFIGSRLARDCAGRGWSVVGLDCLRPYYDVSQKLRNLEELAQAGEFEFREVDLHDTPLDRHLDGADVVFHLAGQPGVRASWDTGFADYCRDNILATQSLLEAAVRSGVRRVVYSSSSSVYGDADTYPVSESALPRPISPYGVSKLAGEHLCLAYAARGDVDVVALRYFTVYGPGQRPDMAIHRLISSALTGGEFRMYGDGLQIRDFTYVADAVRANVLAATARGILGSVVANIAGGSQVSLMDVIKTVEDVAGRPVNLLRGAAQAGDVRRTGGDINAAAAILGWAPSVSLEDGVRNQVTWQQSLDGVSA
ncbi:MAG: NAD-dependent epimerase/dehydratase family protein [Mycobacteriales bacterium]